MKRIFIILIVLLGIIAAGAYFLFQKAITPTELPTAVMNAEDAVATSGTIAIASVDMSFIRRVDKMFNPGKDPSPLPAVKPADPADEKSLFEKLEKQGIDLISQTDHALAAVSITEGKPAYSFVLFGRFSQDKLKRAVSQQYLVEDSSSDYLLISKIPEQDKKDDPCAKPSAKKVAIIKHALHIKKDRLVLSSPDMMPVLLKRLAGKARAGISLTKWREFRKGKAVAGALMSPSEANKSAVDLPSALVLGALSKQPLKDIYAGAIVSVLPSPGFTFLIDAHSNDAAWPLDFKTKYDAWVSDAVSDLVEMPTLTALIKTLSVQADGTILRVKTIANQQTLDNLEKIPGEFVQMAFSGIFDSKDAGPAGAEQIVKASEVEKYARQFDFSSVQAFDATNEFFKPDFISGPFGVRIKRIGLLATDNSVIELKVGVDAKGFENLSSEMMHKTDQAVVTSLSITSVEDKAGNNLLREELCGKIRNLLAEPLTTSRDKEYKDNQWIPKSIKVSGDKSVRLKPNVFLSQVDKVKGKITVAAATRTKVKTLQIPFSGKTIENGKVRMYFRKNTAGTVRYTLSGNMNHILAVRAKNAKGQYLAGAGSSASGKETKMVSKRFKGKVASIEVIVADEMKTRDYPFEVNQVVPRYGKKGSGKKVEMMITSKSRFLRNHKNVKYQNECKDKQKVRAGAFMICLNKFGDRFGRETGGEFDVVAPYDEALQNDMAAVVLSIDTVMTESGEKIKFAKNEKVSFVYKFDASFNKKKKDWEILNRRLRGSYVNVYSDTEELKNKKISSLQGTLTVRLPKHPKYIELGADDLGVFKTKDGLTVNVAAFADWNTYVDVQGKADKVMRFMPLAKGGIVLKTDNDRINEKQYSTWGLSGEDKEKIEALPKKMQGMITIYEKPEVIRVFYANNFETIKYKFQFSLDSKQGQK